jgi:predicted esterase YcpF (UPF0227 family)
MKNILYLHGFGSSATSRSIKILREIFSNFNIIAPELNPDVKEALSYVNRIINNRKIDLIVGTSLGGFLAIVCKNTRIPVLAINPTIRPSENLKKFLGKNSYLNSRKDGSLEFNLTQYDLIKFIKYESTLEDKIESNAFRIWVILSSKDENLKDSSEMFENFLTQRHIIKTNQIGHCLEEDFIRTKIKQIITSILEETEEEDK